MELKWLQTFCAAAKHENLRKASEELYITQPAITKHIQRLEDFLQTELFIREGKSIRLSVAGHRFYPIAKSMLEDFEGRMASFQSWQQGYHQKLTIAVAPQIASSILPSILKGFMQTNPEIEVYVNVVNSYEVTQEVQEGNADIGLTRIYIPQARINCEIALQEPVVLVVREEEESCTEAEIFKNYRIISHNHPLYWDDLLVEIKQHYPQVQSFKVNQVEVTKSFIEEGLGVSYLPFSMIVKELKIGTLKIIESHKIQLPISQTYLLSKVQSAEVESFTAFFMEEIRKFDLL